MIDPPNGVACLPEMAVVINAGADTGHADIREIERYWREAARKKRAVAATTKLEGGFDTRLPNPPDELGNNGDSASNHHCQKQLGDPGRTQTCNPDCFGRQILAIKAAREGGLWLRSSRHTWR